jgi:hypothetical protein
MSSRSAEIGLPRCDALVEQRLQVAGHIAAIVQRAERIEDRHLDGLLETRPQMVGKALALHLRPHPRQQLIGINGAHDIVVDPHIEAAQQARIVAQLDDRS